jgi:putative ABC transport system substrate-binding protein
VLRRRSLVPLALATGLADKASAQTARQARIGVMWPTPDSMQPLFDAFAAGLAESGFVIGRDVLVEIRYHDGDVERMAAQAAELAAMKVDVIYAPTTENALAAKKATSTIPIVFAGPADPVGVGLVASLAHPGGNITGMSSQHLELGFKQLQYVLQAIPDITRLAILFHPANPTQQVVIGRFRQLAEPQKIEITAISATVPGDIEPAFDRMAAVAAQALMVLDSPFAFVNRARLIELATQHKLPNSWGWPYYVQAGGLMSYGPFATDIVRGGGAYVARILRGASPGDLPIQQPTRFQLVVSQRAARAIGLVLPETFLAAADEVIE